MSSRITGSVRIVGAGLLGTSIGLALSKNGVDVIIVDQSASAVQLATSYGAGRTESQSDLPTIVIVCVPPEVTAETVIQELKNHPQAVVTDVASVKKAILEELTNQSADISRYVGSHPMAGRERSGAIAGRADLFIGRPWVISPTDATDVSAVTQIENLAMEIGAAPVRVSAAEHDRAVALVSHLPQAVASLTASRLIGAESQDVALAGQGLRDTIRIAASDPGLWGQIFAANASEVADLLEQLNSDLEEFISALRNVDDPEATRVINSVLLRGNQGSSMLPGKHGAKATEYSIVTVIVDDKPGELARLLTEVGEIGVNLEELKLEHSPSSAIGLAELYVLPNAEQKLIEDLQTRGWRMVG